MLNCVEVGKIKELGLIMKMNIQHCHLSCNEMFKAIGIIENGEHKPEL
jgi:hypothetical protein